MTELNLEQIFWKKLTQNEKRAYVLFSIPVWFDDLLSHALLNKLNSVKKLDYDKIKQNFTMVYRYEAKGFCYDNKAQVHK